MNTPLPIARPASQVTDADLVARVLAGDAEAYAGLVRRHQDAVYRHARGLGLDHDTSADVVQDAFVKAFDCLGDCRDGAHYRAWLFRICRNLCFDELRNVRRRRSIPMSDVEFAESIEDLNAGPDEFTLTFREALDRVPRAHRDAFLLKHDAGYTYEEIAQLTEASPSAVKMRVHRAREAIRVFLERQGVGGDDRRDRCDNPDSVERPRDVDAKERQANVAQANGAPANLRRRMS